MPKGRSVVERVRGELIRQIPVTRLKLAAARVLFSVVSPFVSSTTQTVRRGGIQYELDLTEGIDLSIFLFGKFQPHVFELDSLRLAEAPVIFDVGANIGAVALQYAHLTDADARIFAFEPTDYAFEKLERNVALNPGLANKVELIKAFVSNTPEVASSMEAFSSWKIAGTRDDGHPYHGGIRKPATETPAIALDDFVRERSISRVDLIKVDTDGWEPNVLEGAREVLATHRPTIVFEAGQYSLTEKGRSFAEYFDLLDPLDYQMSSLATGQTITRANWAREIPRRWMIDVLATSRA